MLVEFPTTYSKILQRVKSIDPVAYGSSRNYIDGAVTKLSPYISRGVISTKQVFQEVLQRGFKPYQVTKFLQELAWRDYFQQVWKSKPTEIHSDIKQPQSLVHYTTLPKTILPEIGDIGIPSLNRELKDFYETGYLHNHVRMYIASILCNVAGTYWKQPAAWMYYYLLDADFASNTCSWQWVSGAFSSKKYIANQENINRYLKANDLSTFLDTSYENISLFESIPDIFSERVDWESLDLWKTTEDWALEKMNFAANDSEPTFVDNIEALNLESGVDTLLYDFYNLDPKWFPEERYNRVLCLSPSFFKKYPSSPNTLNFVYNLAKNIPGIQMYWGEVTLLQSFLPKISSKLVWKEHPIHIGLVGREEPRDWMFPEVKGYYPSFFTYWKKCEKYWERKMDFSPNLFEA